MTFNPVKLIATNAFKKKYLKLHNILEIDIPEEIIERWEKLKKDYAEIDKENFAKYCYNNFNPRQNNYQYKNFYLRTTYWKIISNYIKLTRNKCEFGDWCDNTYLDVHHYTYIILGKEIENEKDLRVYCSSCHTKLHNYTEYNGKNKVNTDYELKLRLGDLEDNIASLNSVQKKNDNLSLSNITIENDNFDSTLLKCKGIILRYEIIN